MAAAHDVTVRAFDLGDELRPSCLGFVGADAHENRLVRPDQNRWRYGLALDSGPGARPDPWRRDLVRFPTERERMKGLLDMGFVVHGPLVHRADSTVMRSPTLLVSALP